MPIQVTCQKCHARFNVSEKFAGQTGPCPKCKAPIRVPTKSEEVVIHTPEQFGPKDAEGRAVLKPIERTQTNVSPVAWVVIIGGVVLVVIVAYLVGRSYQDDHVPPWLLGLGAAALAPPLVWAGYSFLRNDDLEPYRGMSLLIRVVICAVVYAALWGAYAVVSNMLFGGRTPELWHLAFLVPAFVSSGALAPLASLDLDFTNGCIHYGMYLLVTVALRLLMGLPAV